VAGVLGPVDPAALAAHLLAGATTPFEFGRCDCTLWVADWVRSRLGEDPAGPWRGRYRTRAGWRRLVRGVGLPETARRALRAAGAPEIDPRDAMPGDVGMIETTDGPAMAIRGQSGWFAKTGAGIWRAADAFIAWRL
jgi:hypothetical protein